MRTPPDWTTDPAGVQHWRPSDGERYATVEDAAARCLDELHGRIHGRVCIRPAVFWYRGTFAPVRLDLDGDDDTVTKLVDRWHAWRTEELASPGLLTLITEWSTRHVPEVEKPIPTLNVALDTTYRVAVVLPAKKLPEEPPTDS